MLPADDYGVPQRRRRAVVIGRRRGTRPVGAPSVVQIRQTVRSALAHLPEEVETTDLPASRPSAVDTVARKPSHFTSYAWSPRGSVSGLASIGPENTAQINPGSRGAKQAHLFTSCNGYEATR